jgi:hypothetical protein
MVNKLKDENEVGKEEKQSEEIGIYYISDLLNDAVSISD